MWRVGQDATLRMTVGALLILDRPPTTKALAERLAVRGRASAPVAPAARRPDGDADPPGLGRRPRSGARAAISDRSRSPRRVDCARCSTSSACSSRSRSTPSARRGTLTLIEGLEDGRAALYLRAHHVLTDGVGGIRLLGLLLDEPTGHASTSRLRRAKSPVAAETSGGRRPPAGHVDDHHRSPARRCAGSSAASTRPATWIRSTPPCAASNEPSTSPTRSPAS